MLPFFLQFMYMRLQTPPPSDPTVDKQVEFLEKLLEMPTARVLFVVAILAVLALMYTAFQMARLSQNMVNTMAKNTNDNMQLFREGVDKVKERVEEIGEKQEENYLLMHASYEQVSNRVNSLVETDNLLLAGVNNIIDTAGKLHIDTQAKTERGWKRMAAMFANLAMEERGTTYAGMSFQFPDNDDCRWQMARIKPVEAGGVIKTFKLPLLIDAQLDGIIPSEGEIVRLIDKTTLEGWAVATRNPAGSEEQRHNCWIFDSSMDIEFLEPTTPQIVTVEKNPPSQPTS